MPPPGRGGGGSEGLQPYSAGQAQLRLLALPAPLVPRAGMALALDARSTAFLLFWVDSGREGGGERRRGGDGRDMFLVLTREGTSCSDLRFLVLTMMPVMF